jgi:predicted enzyme involved in methoxymalonyl-ACP biosynthesis
MSARDRFGDQGITGTIFLEPKDSLTLSIDTLLLSCRILGKGIEEAFFKTVLNLMRLDGYRNLTAEYIPTAKNSQTADFYDRMGMECTAVDDDGTKHYQMRLENVFDIKNYYNVRVL